jgi:hypothetical protein
MHNGQAYYYNTITGESRWDLPPESSSAAQISEASEGIEAPKDATYVKPTRRPLRSAMKAKTVLQRDARGREYFAVKPTVDDASSGFQGGEYSTEPIGQVNEAGDPKLEDGIEIPPQDALAETSEASTHVAASKPLPAESKEGAQVSSHTATSSPEEARGHEIQPINASDESLSSLDGPGLDSIAGPMDSEAVPNASSDSEVVEQLDQETGGVFADREVVTIIEDNAEENVEANGKEEEVASSITQSVDNDEHLSMRKISPADGASLLAISEVDSINDSSVDDIGTGIQPVSGTDAESSSAHSDSAIESKKIDANTLMRRLKRKYATLRMEFSETQERVQAQEEELIDLYSTLAKKIIYGEMDADMMTGEEDLSGRTKYKTALQIDKLKHKLDTSTAMLSEKEEELADLRAELAALKSTYESATKALHAQAMASLKQMKTDKAIYTEKLRKKSSTMEVQIQELRELRAVVVAKNNSLIESHATIAENSQQLEVYARNNSRLAIEIELMQLNVTQLTETIDTKENELKSCMAAINELHQILDEREEGISRLEVEALDLINADAVLRSSIAMQESQIGSIQRECGRVWELLQTHTARVSVMSHHLVDKLHSFETLLDDLTHLFLVECGLNSIIFTLWSDDRFAIDRELKLRDAADEETEKHLAQLEADNKVLMDELSSLSTELEKYNVPITEHLVSILKKTGNDIVKMLKSMKSMNFSTLKASTRKHALSLANVSGSGLSESLGVAWVDAGTKLKTLMRTSREGAFKYINSMTTYMKGLFRDAIEICAGHMLQLKTLVEKLSPWPQQVQADGASGV